MRSLILATLLVATALLPAEADTQKGLAAPLQGLWRGKEVGGDHASDLTVAFEAEAGSLTYEHGTAAIGLRIPRYPLERRGQTGARFRNGRAQGGRPQTVAGRDGGTPGSGGQSR
jgi:hypothetical protein